MKKTPSFKEKERLFSQGLFTSSTCFSVIFLRNSYSCSRLMISVKKRLGNAVERNYHKRVVRVLFREYYSKLVGPCDCCIIVKDPQASFAHRKDAFCSLIKKMNKLLNKIGEL